MHIFITGGLGFVGRHLTEALLEAGHTVAASGRSENPEMIDHPGFDYVAADTTKAGPWQDAVKKADAAVNLAGASIFGLWTESRKQEMYDSRILTTRHLVAALKGGNARVLCSTSAVGYYGCRDEQTITEEDRPDNDYLARLAIDWEKEASVAEKSGIRVVTPRFGIVLDRDGGAMAKMIPAFRLMMGGPLGDGRQWFPWIHMRDLVQATIFCLNLEQVRGPLNFCAPEPVRNETLAKTLGEVLGRPAVMRAPAFVLRKFLGEFGEVLLCSQRVVPERLQELGFEFRFADLKSALAEIVERDPGG